METPTHPSWNGCSGEIPPRPRGGTTLQCSSTWVAGPLNRRPRKKTPNDHAGRNNPQTWTIHAAATERAALPGGFATARHSPRTAAIKCRNSMLFRLLGDPHRCTFRKSHPSGTGDGFMAQAGLQRSGEKPYTRIGSSWKMNFAGPRRNSRWHPCPPPTPPFKYRRDHYGRSTPVSPSCRWSSSTTASGKKPRSWSASSRPAQRWTWDSRLWSLTTTRRLIPLPGDCAACQEFR